MQLWSWKVLNFMVLLLILTVPHSNGPGMVEISQCYCLFWQFYTFYGPGMFENSQFYCSSIVTLLWIGLAMNNLDSLWSLMGPVMVDFSLNLKGGLWWRWNEMHWLTCELGRGSPASDSLSLSRWSLAVTSANAGPNPLHNWIDCGCCLHGLLWCTRRWTPIPGTEGWSIKYSTAWAWVEPGMSAANLLGSYEVTVVWWDEWWDSLLVCVIYLLASGGFLCLLAATMYHYYCGAVSIL